MKLTDDWRIEQKDGNSFILIQIVKAGKFQGKESKKEFKDNKYYYGTLYQALQAYLVKKTQGGEDLYDVGLDVQAVLHDIISAKDEIKREFRTEVRVKN